MTPSVRLRPYQQEVVSALEAYWRNGGGNPLIDHATGTGKSLLIGDLVWRVCRRGKRRMLIITHVRELLDQDAKAIRKLWPGAEISFNCDALGERDWSGPIILASIQSIHRAPERLGKIDCIAIDECHLVPKRDSGMYRKVIRVLTEINPNLRVIGYSATVYRLDSGRLDEGEDRIFDEVIHSYTIGDGVRDGYLSPLIAKETDSEIDVSEVGTRGGEFIPSELEAAADTDSLVRGACCEIIDLAVKRYRRSWLVFACGVKHALHARDVMRSLGVSCETVTGETPKDERRRIIKAFRRGEITCLVNVNVLTTGFNVPGVDLIAMLRPTWSPGLFVQMLGRGTRKAEGKENCLVLDFAGNCRRHGPVDTVRGARKKRTGKGGGSAPSKVCPRCRTIVGASTKACPDCGYEFEVTPREPEHNSHAEDDIQVMAVPQWITIGDLYCTRYHKGRDTSNTPTLCVTYDTPEGKILDWLALEHGGWGAVFARRKWAQMGGKVPSPTTVAEALERQNELTRVEAIQVVHEGKWPRIVAYGLAPKRAVA